MKTLEAIEICEIAQIKVMGKKGKLLWDAANECIALSNLLKVSVQLYWNGKVIDIYRNMTIGDVIAKINKP